MSVDGEIGGGGVSSWDDLTDKPTTFPSTWEQVTGKPTEFIHVCTYTRNERHYGF